MQASLQAANIKYIFLGNKLGGRPKEKQFYDESGKVDYRKLSEAQFFIEGLRDVIELSRKSKLALMCGEENPALCHRKLLIGKNLRKNGFSIFHIRSNGKPQSEEDLKNESLSAAKNQLNLF